MYASCRGGYIGFKSTYIEYSYCTYDIPCYLRGKKRGFHVFVICLVFLSSLQLKRVAQNKLDLHATQQTTPCQPRPLN